ncbi:hypothetical protein CHLRE_11g467621v5 [Chlamydomonas reinhardtii]|uniref:Uncharacterized protein n=1 Tax=Chlamydomonas reinhardtii TaxID=3055 RepID=A0A2K3D7G6_CHLRE|nr:uncharacterized protein CHLRE_11g467621v5 [Chlamydomonas reinhardtii]PNW76474.1 hypothetical protein CHLRE_11g467621v5 [Chlamydomonas reinhardtii]
MLHELGRAVERARHWKSTFKRQFFLAAVSLGKCEPGSQLVVYKDGMEYIGTLPATAKPFLLFGTTFVPSRPRGAPAPENPPVPVTLMELTGSKSKPERACDYVREGGALLVQEIMAGREGWLQADLSGKARMLLEIAALEGAPTPGTLAANNPTYNYAVRAFEDAAQELTNKAVAQQLAEERAQAQQLAEAQAQVQQLAEARAQAQQLAEAQAQAQQLAEAQAQAPVVQGWSPEDQQPGRLAGPAEYVPATELTEAGSDAGTDTTQDTKQLGAASTRTSEPPARRVPASLTQQRMAGEVSNSGASGDTCGRTVAVSGIDGSSSGRAGASSGAASGSLPAPPARAAQRSSARLAAPRGQRNITGPEPIGARPAKKKRRPPSLEQPPSPERSEDAAPPAARDEATTEIYRCEVKEVPPALLCGLGLAAVRLPATLTRLINPRLIAELASLADKRGEQIFQRISALQGVQAEIRMSVGTGQRVQVLWKDLAGSAGLLALCDKLRPLLEEVVTAADPKGELGLHLEDAVLLANLPGTRPVAEQVPHYDMAPGEPGWFIMLALQPASLLVAQASQHEVLLWGRAYTAAQEAGRTAAVLKDLCASTPHRRLVRLQLPVGELLFVHSNLVHAGDAGRLDGSYSLRLHWFVKSAKTTNNTHLPRQIHVELEKRFV